MSSKKNKFFLQRFIFLVPLVICLLFFAAYGTLSIVRHNNYQSFGYDLGINDQVIWRYATFQLPIATISPFPDKTKLAEHVELVYILLAPFYWIWDSRKMLLLLEPAFVCSAGLAIYLLARNRRLGKVISNVLVISYLAFYGVQNALWTDVHSITFGAAFVTWFLYAVDAKKRKLSLLFFFLAITAKENVPLITLLISCVYFLLYRQKIFLFFIGFSALYLLFIFKIYFPFIVQADYLYQNKEGLLSNLNPASFFDTKEKITAIFYAFLSFGFLPFFSPLTLIVAIGHFATYFVIASDLPGAQGIYGHYRIMLAPILTWATILTLQRFHLFNSRLGIVVLLLSTCVAQYTLHLPLSYLTKAWFWRQPEAVKTITSIRTQWLPGDAAVVAQNNIVPHISHRNEIYSLYPERKIFVTNSPCGELICNWFRWYDSPDYLFVDISKDWDARHLLIDRPFFIDGLKNLEKAHIITKYKQEGTTILYKVNKNPEEYFPR